MDACKLTKMVSENAIVRPLILFFNESMRGIIHECPYVDWVKIENATFNIHNRNALIELEKTQIFPNGNYKILLHLFNKKDPNIFNMTLFFDGYKRINALNNVDDF